MSSVPEENEEEEKVEMSMTMQQRETREKRERVESLRREIDQLQAKIRMQKEIGEHIAGKTVIFQELIDKYEELSNNVENYTEEQAEEIYEEFIGPIETDMSKAELLPICNTLNRLLIGLNFRKQELAQAESEIAIINSN